MTFSKRYVKCPETVHDKLENVMVASGLKCGPVISNEKLRALETSSTILLPGPYRNFLLHTGNGGPEDDLLPIDEALEYDLMICHQNSYVLILTRCIGMHRDCCFPQSANFSKIVEGVSVLRKDPESLAPNLDHHHTEIPRRYLKNGIRLILSNTKR